MLETILIILFCIVLLSGIGDLLFDALGFGVKVFLGIVLVLASIWLIIKMIFLFVPWIFILSLIGIIVGIIWLIKTIVKKV